MDGTAEVMLTRDPASHPMGYSIDWLPDGRLLTTGDRSGAKSTTGRTPSTPSSGERDRGGRARQRLRQRRGLRLCRGGAPKPGYIKLVTPDGRVRQVAEDIQFPNGMVITPDGRTLVISESFACR